MAKILRSEITVCSRPNTNDYERFAYTVNAACAALSIGRTSLYGLVKKGELKLIQIAGRTLVPRSELERLIRIGTLPRPPLP